jgi:hypothetical protein
MIYHAAGVCFSVQALPLHKRPEHHNPNVAVKDTFQPVVYGLISKTPTVNNTSQAGSCKQHRSCVHKHKLTSEHAWCVMLSEHMTVVNMQQQSMLATQTQACTKTWQVILVKV